MAQTVIIPANLPEAGQELSAWYMPMPATAEAIPIPYSPEGWAQSKLTSQSGKSGAGKAEGGKAESVEKIGFTPEQLAALSKLTGVEGVGARHGAPGAPAAPHNQIGQMAQVQTAPAKTSEQRASLGQILYAGKRF